MRPSDLKISLKVFGELKSIFISSQPVLHELKLSQRASEYYATWVQKAKLSRLKQFPDKNKLHLHLMAFISHQFYHYQDTLVDVLLKSVQAAKNTALNQLHSQESYS